MDFTTIKNRQWVLALALGGCVLGAGLIYLFVSSKSSAPQKKQEFKSSMVTGASRIDPQEAWVYKFTTEAELTRKRMDSLEDMLGKLIKLNEAQKQVEPAQLHQMIESVKEDLKVEQNPEILANTLPPPPSPMAPLNANPMEFRRSAIRKISLSLRNARNSGPLKTVDNTIPAGSFAKAVLLGGVDASASIQASSDPRPALLRITGLGTLPRKFRSDLKGCHALVACYGDIGSERVMMRLEKLTCMERKTGEVIEVKVQGYVAGEDGRTGVRGTVVDRAGESMRNAMIGGFIGGMGEFLSQAKNTMSFSGASGFAQMNPFQVGDALKHGSSKGTSSALDKYADFYIKRAEQVQPVIQVAAGRVVDIVFTEGVAIGDTAYRQATSRLNDQERYLHIQDAADHPEKEVNDWTGEQK